ncbi:MAG: glycosyltransferase [Desulfohalobiaceae bacterium]
MKILYISTAEIPSQSANSINIMSSCSAMAELGHEVALCVPNSRNKYRKDIFSFYGLPSCFDILHLPCPTIPGGRYLYCCYLNKAARKFKPDILFGRYRRGLIALSGKGWPFVLEMHTVIRNNEKRKYSELKEITKSKNFLALITITQKMAEHFQCLPFPELTPDKIFVAPNGSDTRFELKPVKLPRNTSGWQIGYAGSLKAQKGMELISHIAKGLPEHDFHIFGGDDNSIEEWRQLMPWSNVHFHGFVPPGKLPSWLVSLDICLLPNQQVARNRPGEIISSPLKLFDYMSLGKAIIASDFKEIRENISDREALLLPYDQAQAWIETIKKLTQKQISSFGYRTKQLFDAQFTRRIRYAKLLDNLEYKLVDSKSE